MCGSARQDLIEEHLWLVRHVARRFAHRGEEWDDLIQVGAIGLIQAADRYDAARGCTFAAYADPCVAGEIRRHLRDRASVVRIPRRVQQEHARLGRAVDEEERSGGGRATRRTLARRMGVAEGDVDRIRSQPMSVVAWSDEVDVATGDECERCIDRVTVAAALGALGSTERGVLERTFYDDRGQCDIAAELGISQPQVSRILQRALIRLRRELDDRVVA